jgi:dTDP-4-dehydrorhamnose reductase
MMVEKPRILLISGNGQVGYALRKVFTAAGYPVFGTWYDIEDSALMFADVRKRADLEKAFAAACPDVVILNAALTHVDLCEEQPEKAAAINIEGTRLVAQLCNEYSSRIVFFSSEYVFDGQAGPYTEDDPVNPINEYGRQKVEGERIVSGVKTGVLIIRTTVVYGKDLEGKNFVVRLVRSLREGRSVPVPEDQVATPTYSENLAAVTEALVAKGAGGIFNVVGPDRMSRYEFSRIVCEVFGLNQVLLKPVSTAELNQRARRPLSGGLVIDKLRSTVDLPVVGVREGLARLCRDI